MYLHLGQDKVVPIKTIVGIFDLDNTSQSRITREYLAACQKAGQVVNVSEELPKSFVVCQEKGQKKVYISQLSSATLQKRALTYSLE